MEAPDRDRLVTEVSLLVMQCLVRYFIQWTVRAIGMAFIYMALVLPFVGYGELDQWNYSGYGHSAGKSDQWNYHFDKWRALTMATQDTHSVLRGHS